MNLEHQRTQTAPWNWIGLRNGRRFHWEQFTIRCGSPLCIRHKKAQPLLLARFRGIYYNNRWYHQIACVRQSLIARLEELLSSYSQDRNRAHRLPLGLLLISRGAITPPQLREALLRQRQAGAGKLGYWLRQLGHLDELQVAAALSQQWGCPIFPLERSNCVATAFGTPPYLILATAKAVPVYATPDGRLLHIAFSDRIDHTLLYALEEMLGCETVACVSTESAVQVALESLRRHSSGAETCFDSVRDPSEMAATVCSYAAQLDAKRITVARAGGYIWVALFRRQSRRDLVFRVLDPAVSAGVTTIAPASEVFSSPADKRRDGVYDARRPL